ncbi:MAG: serine hydrolase domain-containing protein [Promethearchaeia archaeon]
MDLNISEPKKFIKSRRKELQIPGVAVGMIKNHEILLNEGFGYADLEQKEEVNANTVFRMGSISKTFTTIALFQLIEQGKVTLDQPINDLLPKGKLVSKKEPQSPITLKHLLTHTSGIGELLARRDLFKLPRLLSTKPEKLYPLEKLFSRRINLRHAPGEKWAYANFAFNLIGYIIELISKQEFADYMRGHILQPLKMDHSDFERRARVEANQAKGYKLKRGKNVEFGTDLRVLQPAGSLYASTNDMLNYMQCLLNGGDYNGHQLIKSETLSDLWRSHHQMDSHLPAMGYAFWLYDIEGYKVVGHGGSINGYLAQMYLIPEEELGIIVSVNQMSLRNMEAIRIAHEILHRILDIKKPEAIKKKNLELSKVVEDDLIEEMTGRYGPSKGFLTNVRFYQAGGEIKISFDGDKLLYSTMWGAKKNGVKLWLVNKENPFYYKILDNLSYSCVEPHEAVIFNQNARGKIVSIYKGFHEYFKKPWYQTFKFKLYSRLIIAILGILGFIFILLYFTGL